MHIRPLIGGYTHGRDSPRGQGAFERQCGTFRKGEQVCTSEPRGEVVAQPMRLIVGASDDDERGGGLERRSACGEMRRPSGGRYTKDARLRQMGPKGVNECSNTAITAA